MSIDFFTPKCQTENIREKEFGICDDEDEKEKTPAYIDKNHPDNWVAVVKNQTNKSINFIAVDNCVEIVRSDGTMESRCDAILTNEDNIVFVELKNQKSGWITHAVDEQLQTTIDNFKANHDISKYKHKRAFACNKKHPSFMFSHKEKMNAFFQKNGIRLNLVKEIVFR